jgi:hypothetical protein
VSGIAIADLDADAPKKVAKGAEQIVFLQAVS